MANRTCNESIILNIGNTCILTTDSEFIDGHVTGWLNFYDTRYRPPFPLTSETIYCSLMDILIATEKPVNWRLGAVVGWIEAMCENSQETFKSVLAGEHVSVMQEGVR